MHYGPRLAACLKLFLVGFFLSLLVGVMMPGAHSRPPSERAFLRACFATQRTLTAALEMYELDHGTRVDDLDAPTLEAFRDQSYLQTIPTDPGVGPESTENYFLYRAPRGRPQVMCLRHGFVVPPPGARPGDDARRQLASLGIDPGRSPVGGLSTGPSSSRKLAAGLWELLFLMAALLAAVSLWFGILGLGFFGILEVVARLSHGAPAPVASPEVSGKARVDLATARCPVCADGFGAGSPVASLCPDCRTPHHEPCLRYIGHCAVFACSRTELSEQRRREAIEEKAKAATG
jgi:hypothetical protein